MRHVLVSSESPDLAAALREVADPSTTFVSEHGVDATLERLARSFRIDAVVTDEPGVLAAIREEIPGSIPVHVVPGGEAPGETLRALERLLTP